MDFTHFRFGVGCHDLNGFWYSDYLMTAPDQSHMQEQWEKWKEAEKMYERDPEDDREMLIDQYNPESGDLGDTLVIPSKHADEVQKAIFGDEYDKLKFDIFEVKPMTMEEVRKIVESQKQS